MYFEFFNQPFIGKAEIVIIPDNNATQCHILNMGYPHNLAYKLSLTDPFI